MRTIIRVFPRKTSLTPTDDLAFVGNPPLMRPEADEVHVSCVFSWHRKQAEYLAQAWAQYYPVVRLGGPAYNSPVDGPFVAGMYVKQGVTFTSRGCPRRCGWCVVPEREGALREIADFSDGYIINDNNFIATSGAHRERVYTMLRRQPKAAIFSGGIQASLVTDEVAAELRTIRIDSLFLAADTVGSLKPLAEAVRRLSFLSRDKLRAYMLLAYNGETIREAEERLEAAWEIGVMPQAQLYQPADGWIDYPDEWRQLDRTWCRPAAMRAMHKEQTP
ncbi:MAG: hypothetical protein Q7O66_07520 [Dehalococcoidia bacterium]|nr:hypothetical protein [Dehalococcoidia bacterium]